MYRDTTNVEHEIVYHTENSWSHRNSKTGFKEKFGTHTVGTFNRFGTKDSGTGNITHNTGSTAV